MQGATLVVREHKLYSAYVAHKHSRNISFTKLCETNRSHSGRCGVVASLCEIAQGLLSTLGCLLSDTIRGPLAGLLALYDGLAHGLSLTNQILLDKYIASDTIPIFLK